MRYKEHLIQQPKSLESLAIPKIGHWIALQAKRLLSMENQTEDVLSHNIEAIRHYLDCYVPYTYRDKIVNTAMEALQELVIKTLETEAPTYSIGISINNIIGRMTETFLYSKNLKRLMLYQIGIYVPSFTESYMFSGVTILDVEDIRAEQMIPMIKELHYLKVFKYLYDCTSEVLSCLVQNCKLIEELSLSDIKDEDINLLTLLPNLRCVIFCTVTSISMDGLETLLWSCNNIEVLGFIDDDVLGAFLERMALSEKHAGKCLKLKTLDGYLSLQNLQVVKMCPFLEEVQLHGDFTQENIIHVQDFQELRKLELRELPFSADIKQLLQVKGWCLTELKLLDIEDINLNALINITQMCSNLESLNIGIAHIIPDQVLTKSEENIQQLGKLKDLSISGEQLNNEAFIFILSSCPKVEYITIGENTTVNNYIMLRVLEKNSLSCLKKFGMFENKLSPHVIDKMVQNNNGTELDISLLDYEHHSGWWSVSWIYYAHRARYPNWTTFCF